MSGASLVARYLEQACATSELVSTDQEIATKTGVAINTVRRAVARMVALGRLSVTRRSTQKTTYLWYQVSDTPDTNLVPNLAPNLVPNLVPNGHSLAGAVELFPISSPNKEERKKPTLNPNTKAGSAFAGFWKLYPKHVAKPAAERAFVGAINKGHNPGAILAALSEWLNAGRFSADEKFIPHPATWLNQERWADEIQKPKLPKTEEVFKGPVLSMEEQLARRERQLAPWDLPGEIME